MSGKMAVLACMLEKLRPMGDRIVVVSNSTQVLDLVGTLCRERNVSLATPSPPRSYKSRSQCSVAAVPMISGELLMHWAWLRDMQATLTVK